MRTSTVVILATAAFAAAAAPASATVTSSYAAMGKTLTVTSDGDSDAIVLSCPAGSMLVNGANPDTGPLPCTDSASAGTLVLNGNGGADTIDVTGVKPNATVGTITMDGGEGDDSLTGVYIAGTTAVVSLLGGAGNDTIAANSSHIVRGGAGDDRITGPASTELNGEAGVDTFAFDFSVASPVSYVFTFLGTGMTVSAPGVPEIQTLAYTSIEVVDLVLGEGGQTVEAATFPGSVRVDAGAGADTLHGSSGADVLNGGAGNDFIDGGSGADVFQGGSGLDLIHARDDVADTGDCGADADSLVADAADALVGCEQVDLPAPPPPAPDVAKPVLGVAGGKLRNRKLKLPVSCPATETRCAGIVTLAAVGKRKGASVRVRLGAVTFRLAGGQTKTLTRRLSRGKVRALGRLRRVRLRVSVEVVDAAGNRAKAVERVRLRR